MDEAGGDSTTFFEVTTTLAFQMLPAGGIGYGVVETGLGGRSWTRSTRSPGQGRHVHHDRSRPHGARPDSTGPPPSGTEVQGVRDAIAPVASAVAATELHTTGVDHAAGASVPAVEIADLARRTGLPAVAEPRPLVALEGPPSAPPARIRLLWPGPFTSWPIRASRRLLMAGEVGMSRGPWVRFDDLRARTAFAFPVVRRVLVLPADPYRERRFFSCPDRRATGGCPGHGGPAHGGGTGAEDWRGPERKRTWQERP
jgi:hypothetical protein